MNFLSHYYHDYPINSVYFAAGVILPDILSNYSYRTGEVVKLHPNKLITQHRPELLQLTNGVKRHYEMDAYFHESAFFSENTAWISECIKAANCDCFNKRLYATSHVMLELMLDRALLLQFPEICDALYAQINEVDIETVSHLIAANTTASNPDGVGTHFKVFRERQFLYDYAIDERLTGILNSINIRLGNPPMNETDKNRFKNIIHDIEKTILSQKFPKFPID